MRPPRRCKNHLDPAVLGRFGSDADQGLQWNLDTPDSISESGESEPEWQPYGVTTGVRQPQAHSGNLKLH